MIVMFRKKPILQYESAIEVYPNIITPAKNNIPEWYKKIPRWRNDEVFNINTGFERTIKQCIPFLDCFTTGYVIVLPQDLYVKDNEGQPFLTWVNAEFPPDWRSEVADLNLVPAGHYPIEYTWKASASFVVPVGYSMLLTHPLNRHDLPFTTLSGIVDGGFVSNSKGNIPFYIKKGFEGLIPQGTPIAQLIPFYQQNWSSKIINGLVEIGEKNLKKSTSVIVGWYKNTFWTRKKYD
jgi:hypothetical protein